MSLDDLFIGNGRQIRQNYLPSTVLLRECIAVTESHMTVSSLPILLPSSSLQPDIPVLQTTIHSIPAHSEGQADLRIEDIHNALDEPHSAPFQPTFRDQKSSEFTGNSRVMLDILTITISIQTITYGMNAHPRDTECSSDDRQKCSPRKGYILSRQKLK